MNVPKALSISVVALVPAVTLGLAPIPSTAHSSRTLLIDCDEGQTGGDFIYRGFYIPDYPGSTLDRVDLYFSSYAAGTYTLSLTVRSGTYDGPLIGMAQATVTLTSDSHNNIETSFVFPSVPVPPDIVTFAIGLVSGPTNPYYAVNPTSETCPIIQTHYTNPPLDTVRRHGIRIRVFGQPPTALDIKPGSCPNSFNRNSNGVLPVALVGTGAFDVTLVDISSLQISRADGVGGSAAPNEGPPGPHTVLEDVTAPFAGGMCECHELPADGIMDLSMKYWSNELVEALELDDLPAGEFVELELSGALVDGTAFAALDCIRLVPPGDMDGDGAVGVADLLGMLAAWGSCPAPPTDCLADINSDGDVGVADFLTLLANWGSWF
jgi:hypothetical protein